LIISGVYKIEDVVTGNVYVGTADKDNGIKKRWSNHIAKLRKGKYGYKELQDAYNVNPKRIKWEILEDTTNIKFPNSIEENEYLKEREKYYINYCNLIDGWTVINRDKNPKRKNKVKDTSNMSIAQIGENNGHNTKLSEEDVFEILDMLKDGVNRELIEEKYNICKGYTYRIGKDRWIHTYKKWKENCIDTYNFLDAVYPY
jgi:hypothetical protein